jgi:small subunit ribosomal protein S9
MFSVVYKIKKINTVFSPIKTIKVFSKRKKTKVSLIVSIFNLEQMIKIKSKFLNKQYLILINNKNLDNYFINSKDYHREVLLSLSCVEFPKSFFLILNIKIKGGGFKSQVNCILFAISKFLSSFFKDSTYEGKLLLKKNLFFRLDPRKVERKKYGLKKARKAPQYHKR